MAHACEYETVKLEGITASMAVEGVGVGLGVGVGGTVVGFGGDKGLRVATGIACEPGCDGFALGVAVTLLQSDIVIHPGSGEALCASKGADSINISITRQKMKNSPMVMPTRSVPNRRTHFHFGSRGGER